jgi:hypothetical protein
MPYGDLIAVGRVAEAVKAPGWQTRDADDAGKIYSPSLRICWEKIPNHDGPRLGFAPDSPQEQSGFELWVPPACDAPGSHKVRCCGQRKDLLPPAVSPAVSSVSCCFVRAEIASPRRYG